MAFKPLFFASLLLAAIASPMAGTQSPGGLIGTLLGLIRIQGIVPCSLNAILASMALQSQLSKCRGAIAVWRECACRCNHKRGGCIFHGVGSSPTAVCGLAVTTPLSTCNANLPSVGGLLSSLQLAGNTLVGLLNVADIIPAGFKFLPSI